MEYDESAKVNKKITDFWPEFIANQPFILDRAYFALDYVVEPRQMVINPWNLKINAYRWYDELELRKRQKERFGLSDVEKNWWKKPASNGWKNLQEHPRPYFHPTIPSPPINLRQSHLSKGGIDGKLCLVELRSPLRPPQDSSLLKLPQEVLNMIIHWTVIRSPEQKVPYQDTGSECDLCPHYDLQAIKRLVEVSHQLWQSARPFLYHKLQIDIRVAPVSQYLMRQTHHRLFCKESQLLRIQAARGLCRMLHFVADDEFINEKGNWTKGDMRMIDHMQKALGSVRCVDIEHDVDLHHNEDRDDDHVYDRNGPCRAAILETLSNMPRVQHLGDFAHIERYQVKWTEQHRLQIFTSLKRLESIRMQDSSVESIRLMTKPHQQWLTNLDIRSPAGMLTGRRAHAWEEETWLQPPWLPNLKICKLKYWDVVTTEPAGLVKGLLGPSTHTVILDCSLAFPFPLPWYNVESSLRDFLVETAKNSGLRKFVIENAYSAFIHKGTDSFEFDKNETVCYFLEELVHEDPGQPLFLSSYEKCENPLNALERVKEVAKSISVNCELDLVWWNDEDWKMLRNEIWWELIDIANNEDAVIRFQDSGEYT
ncbi:hypothetical protein BT63DRAFT_430623 [Microthyrium microscopicum]|uniref:Uncharacterized protein n=1 Tax=Microthyrium microscopicum TaxID=703497 RepID=A0A6A6TTP2_9PEZI|nr:hypothetical protein BT63DRAFT_430623 [Microthyrium microscopicum]